MTLFYRAFYTSVFRILAVSLISFAPVALEAADGAKPLTEGAVRTFEEKFSQAWLSNDASKVREFLAPDFINVLPNGKLQTADVMLSMIKDGQISFSEYRLDNFKVRVYGDTAVVTYIIRGKMRLQGKEADINSATTDVIVCNDQGLKVVSSHSSNLAAPKSRELEP